MASSVIHRGVQLNALDRNTALPPGRRGLLRASADRDAMPPAGRRGVQLNALDAAPEIHSNPEHHRRSIRLQNYDYSQTGAYFVTICTQNRLPYFENPAIHSIASDCWLEIPSHFSSVDLDEWVIMPNHLHGILVIENAEGVQLNAPTTTTTRISGNPFSAISPHRNTLAVVIRTYKAAVTTTCRQQGQDFGWQRNYYERVIRNEDELNRIRQYIINNPLDWDADELNPASDKSMTSYVGAFN